MRNKKTITTVVICVALVLTIGATTAFAANAAKNQMLVKNENGSHSYSEDGGATWTDGIPEGTMVATSEDGKTYVTIGEAPALGEGYGLMVKTENGVTSYSTDGGQTWNEDLPDGATVKTNPDGSFSVEGGLSHRAPGAEGSKMEIRNEIGVISYSTDGSETWTEGLPNAAKIITDGEGRGFVTMGEPALDGTARSLLVKNENGVISYSTDGGQTWSDNVPEGLDVEKDADGKLSMKVI